MMLAISGALSLFFLNINPSAVGVDIHVAVCEF
jgi:hypothetical protein